MDGLLASNCAADTRRSAEDVRAEITEYKTGVRTHGLASYHKRPAPAISLGGLSSPKTAAML